MGGFPQPVFRPVLILRPSELKFEDCFKSCCISRERRRIGYNRLYGKHNVFTICEQVSKELNGRVRDGGILLLTLKLPGFGGPLVARSFNAHASAHKQ